MFHGKGNLFAGYKMLDIYKNILYIELCDLYYSYEKPFEFAHKISILFKDVNTANVCISSMVGRHEARLSLNGIKKIKKIIKLCK